MRILVVDDEYFIRKSLKKILVSEGYQVHGTSDGKRAIEIIKKKKFDLVLLDLKMNGMDGISVLREIRKINRKIPVILISGYLTMEHIEEACKHGIFSYIRKPFEVRDLNHKIKRAIETARLKSRDSD